MRYDHPHVFRSVGNPGRCSPCQCPRQSASCEWCSLSKVNFIRDGHLPPGALCFKEPPIGEGSFGKVYKGEYFNAPAAMKYLKPSELRSLRFSDGGAPCIDNEQIKNHEREGRILKSLGHPNVLDFYAFTYNPPCIIMEYCPDGSLYNSLYGRNPLRDWRKKLGIVKGIAAGMMYLHERSVPIVHCVLKSANILMGRCGQPKIADVGLAKFVRVENQLPGNDKAVEDINFLCHPPEVILSKDGSAFSQKSDVYSMGIIMSEILTHRIPFDADRARGQGVRSVVFNRMIAEKIVNGFRPEIPEDLTEIPGWHPVLKKYISLMKRCWSHNPDDRPTFRQFHTKIKKILQAYEQAVPIAKDNAICSFTEPSLRLLKEAALGVVLWNRPFADLDLCGRIAYALTSMGYAVSLFNHCGDLLKSSAKKWSSWVREKFRKRKRSTQESFLLVGYMSEGLQPSESPFKKQRTGQEDAAANQTEAVFGGQSSLLQHPLGQSGWLLPRFVDGPRVHDNQNYPYEELPTPFGRDAQQMRPVINRQLLTANGQNDQPRDSGNYLSHSGVANLENVDHMQGTIPTHNAVAHVGEADMFVERDEEGDNCGLSCVPTVASVPEREV